MSELYLLAMKYEDKCCDLKIRLKQTEQLVVRLLKEIMKEKQEVEGK